MKSRSLIILAVIVIAIVGAAMLFLKSQPAPPILPPVVTATPPPIPAAPKEDKQVTARTQPATPPPAKPETPTPAMEEAPQLAEWEMRIDRVLQTNAGETETAQMLINMVPALPPEGQAEAAQHISNLIADKDYNRVMPLLKNTNLAEEVHDVFVTDLMNREDAVKLPALLEIAKIPNHPHHEEAQTDLQIFLDEDYGNNWTQWETAMKEYLRKQAAEESDSEAAAPAQR